METEARGQLGGLETTDEARRRFARESGAWRCPTCQVPNAEIIKDCEERSQQSMQAESEITIPQELTMAWKDEMGPQTSTAVSVDGAGKTSDDTDLAEGFVQTTSLHNAPELRHSSTRASADTGFAPSRARDGQVLDAQQPLRQAHPTTPHGRPAGQDDDDGTPLWIDRAIVVLVVVLFALLIKVLFGV